MKNKGSNFAFSLKYIEVNEITIFLYGLNKQKFIIPLFRETFQNCIKLLLPKYQDKNIGSQFYLTCLKQKPKNTISLLFKFNNISLLYFLLKF